MEKPDYVRPQMEVIEFENVDVIATSNAPSGTFASYDPYEGSGY